MLTVSDQAYDALEQGSIDQWLDTVVPQVQSRHPDWSKEQGSDGVRRICRELEAFSKEYDLSEAKNFWRLLDARVDNPELLVSLTEYQAFALGRKGFSETMRLDRFLIDRQRGSHTRMIKLSETRETGQ